MIVRVLIFGTLISHLLGLSTAFAIEVLVPESHVSTVHPRISVVGRTGASMILLDLNGKLNQTLAVKDSVFHVRLPLPYGLNRITLHLPDNSPQIENPVELQILCGPRIPPTYKKVFGSSFFHRKSSREECIRCHGPGDGASQEGDRGMWCYTCHGDIKQRFSTHGAEEENICTNCHLIEPDMSRKTASIYSDMNPCYLCHQNKIGEFAQDYIHGPVAGGTCTVCHNPHGSQFDNNLRSPLPVLCLFCHTEVAGMHDEVVHVPFEKGQCTECHDPHATGNRWVLVQKTGKLCLGCHQEDILPENHSHPIGGQKPKSELISGLSLDEKGLLECLTCHLPHGSQADFLLRSSSSNGCRECHPEY